MFGNLMFAAFPLLIILLAFFGSLSIAVFKNIIPTKHIILFSQYAFVLFGMSIGAFGLFGREIMNRRFGHASLVAYSSRTLPLSEKKIFANFVAKDVIFYFFLWILPFAAGFAFASPFLSLSLLISVNLLLAMMLSFMIGLSFVFLLSTIYSHSSRFFVGAAVVLALSAVVLSKNYYIIDILYLLPSVSFFINPSIESVILSLILILIPSYLSIYFMKTDYPEKNRRFRNSLDVISQRLRFSKYSYYVSKDFLDLQRSEGGIGKIFFSFLFPVFLAYILLSVFFKFVPFANPVLIFSILLGVIASSIYNWLTEFDLFSSYSFLPVKVSFVIKSKIISYIIINIISFSILVLVIMKTNQFAYFLPALLSFLAVSSYALSVTVYLTGLYPNILLYNSRVLLEYLFSIVPVLLFLILLSVFNPLYLLVSPALILISLFIIKQSYKKWDSLEQQSF